MPEENLSSLSSRIQIVEHRLNTHKHLKADGTQELNKEATVTETTYGGTFNGGASTPFPAGWTASQPSTGFANVTHNLNTSHYTIAVFFYQLGVNADIQSKGSNSFVIRSLVGGVDTNTSFDFIVKVQA